MATHRYILTTSFNLSMLEPQSGVHHIDIIFFPSFTAGIHLVQLAYKEDVLDIMVDSDFAIETGKLCEFSVTPCDDPIILNLQTHSLFVLKPYAKIFYLVTKGNEDG